MPIKDILVGLATRGEEDRARDFALSMGAEFSAQVTGIAYARNAIFIGGTGTGKTHLCIARADPGSRLHG